MNYTQEALRTMQEISKKNPELSFGDLVQSCFQSSAVKNNQSLQFFREMKDEDIYTIVENVNIAKEELITEEDFEFWVNSK